MRAMVLEKSGSPLVLRDMPKPRPARGQLLVRVATCAVCRTDLHIVDGELPDPKLPLILGHERFAKVASRLSALPAWIDVSRNRQRSSSRLGMFTLHFNRVGTRAIVAVLKLGARALCPHEAKQCDDCHRRVSCEIAVMFP
jgi:hypothetical protein